MTTSPAGSETSHVDYLDWLRVFAMASIFFFHNNRLFDNDSWHVNNAQTSEISTIFVEIFNLWMMPLFFVLSGAAVYFSLRRRSGKAFTKERALRIALPWIVLGMFVMSPPQVYLERLTQSGFTGSLFQFIPQYFDGFSQLCGDIPLGLAVGCCC